MEANDQKHLSEERRFIDYLMPMLYSVLGNLDCIISQLDKKTFSERTTQREVPGGRGKKNCNQN